MAEGTGAAVNRSDWFVSVLLLVTVGSEIRYLRRGTPTFGKPTGCSTGKFRYATEADAIEGLVRVRRERVASRLRDTRPHESHLYPCDRCTGWHLSSSPIFMSGDLIPDQPRRGREPLEMYARRLENRVAEQRSQIMSLLATGNGATNRETRKRIGALTVALGRVTELWQEERGNREALVARLSKIESTPRRRWLGSRTS